MLYLNRKASLNWYLDEIKVIRPCHELEEGGLYNAVYILISQDLIVLIIWVHFYFKE